MTKLKRSTQIVLLAAMLLLPAFPASAGDTPIVKRSSYVSLNQSTPPQAQPLVIEIGPEQSLAYHWQAGQEIAVQAYVEGPAGERRFLRDSRGERSWTVVLGEKASGTVTITPALNNYSGRLVITGNNKILSAPTPYLSETLGRTLEKVCESRFRDGSSLKVHYTDQILNENGVAASFPKQVLDAAVIAYQTITHLEGFSTAGYSFANPDKNYAYDPDKIINIYLGSVQKDNAYKFHGFTSQSYRDAPCFDTVKRSEKAYDAVILLPANYREFIQNWEKLNPSSLGARNINLDLRGTLIHEMLHVVIFYYNKNLNRETGEVSGPRAGEHRKNLDWYVEGLARYFETFAGARHDFYSQGFRETLPDKIRFSRGGSNYFMRYPDQPFTELRYENAIFWRFIDYQFGMKTIEALSRSFRGAAPEDIRQTLEAATHVSFREILKRFSLAALLNDFGLKEDAIYLKGIARTKLLFKNSGFYLLDGYGREKEMGFICRTDWIGEWGSTKAHFEELSVGGDNTNAADVSGWATDFYEITLDSDLPKLPTIKISHDGNGQGLLIQLVLQTRAGSVVTRDWDESGGAAARSVNVAAWAAQERIAVGDIAKMNLLITNLDGQKSVNYEIASSI